MKLYREEKILEEIEKIKKSKILALVEGKHDFSALRQLGIKNVFVLNKTGVSIYSQIETLMNSLKEKPKRERIIAILTDLDKKGKRIYEMIKKEFIKEGIKVNNELRLALLKQHVSHIEGLPTFLEKIGLK